MKKDRDKYRESLQIDNNVTMKRLRQKQSKGN